MKINFFLKKFRSDYPDLSAYLVFLVISIIAYYQVAFLISSLRWDMVDCYLPWRFFAGECLQNHILPLWNPYQHLGYPIHADLRSVWNPEVFLIGLTTGYSNYTLHYLFIFYISLAGFGVYLLSRNFHNSVSAAYLSGVAYMLSGYFTGRGQDLGWIIAAAWLPFVLYFYLKMNAEPSFPAVLKFVFFTFLLITGGYQAHTIILFYFLLAIFIYYTVVYLKRRDYKTFRQILFNNVISLIIILLLCTVLIITVLQVSPYIGRFGGMSLKSAQFNPFSPQSLISLLLPFATVSSTHFFNTDVSMCNAFMGSIILLFAFTALLHKPKGPIILLLTAGLLSLLASFGSYLPVREILFHYLPGMNLFRMPAVFVIFFILPVILLAGNGLAAFFEQDHPVNQTIKKTAIVISGIYFGLLVFSAFKSRLTDSFSFVSLHDFLSSVNHSDIYAHIFINSAVQFILTGIFAFILVRRKSNSGLRKALAILIILEMIIAVQLNINNTVVSTDKPSDIHNELSKRPSGFPVPAGNPVGENSDSQASFGPLWRNTQIFSKNPGFEGFNSFILDSYDYLSDSLPLLRTAVLKNPEVYLSADIQPVGKILVSRKKRPEPDILYVPDQAIAAFQSEKPMHSKGDTAIITSFSPEKISVKVESAHSQMITLLQADYPGWEVFENNKKISHFTSNLIFISAPVPAGSTQIDFIYSNTLVRQGFLISWFTLAALVITIFILQVITLKRKNPFKAVLFVSFVVILCICIAIGIIINRNSGKERKEDLAGFSSELNKLIQLKGGCLMLLNLEKPGLVSLPWAPESSVKFLRFTQENKLSELNKLVSHTNYRNLVYGFSDVYSPPSALLMMHYYFNSVIMDWWRSGPYTVIWMSKFDHPHPFAFCNINDFEYDNPLWTKNINSYDSTVAFTGKYSCRLDTINRFSPAFVMPFGKLYNRERLISGGLYSINCFLNLIADVHCQEGARLFLVIEILRNGERILYKTSEVEGLPGKEAKWDKAFLTVDVKEIIKSDDVVKAYIWNDGKQVVNIDNMTVVVDDLPQAALP